MCGCGTRNVGEIVMTNKLHACHDNVQGTGSAPVFLTSPRPLGFACSKDITKVVIIQMVMSFSLVPRCTIGLEYVEFCMTRNRIFARTNQTLAVM